MTGRVIALELSSSTASLPLSAKEGRKEREKSSNRKLFFLNEDKESKRCCEGFKI